MRVTHLTSLLAPPAAAPLLAAFEAVGLRGKARTQGKSHEAASRLLLHRRTVMNVVLHTYLVSILVAVEAPVPFNPSSTTATTASSAGI